MFDKIITTNTTKTNEMDNVVELLEEILIRMS